MGKAIDNAKKHFQNLGPVRIKVKQWGDESGPLVIVADPMTLEDKIRLAEITTQRSAVDGYIWVLIRYAKDESGKKLFDLDDKLTLKKQVDPDVLMEVVKQITRSKDVDDMENL